MAFFVLEVVGWKPALVFLTGCRPLPGLLFTLLFSPFCLLQISTLTSSMGTLKRYPESRCSKSRLFLGVACLHAGKREGLHLKGKSRSSEPTLRVNTSLMRVGTDLALVERESQVLQTLEFRDGTVSKGTSP